MQKCNFWAQLTKRPYNAHGATFRTKVVLSASRRLFEAGRPVKRYENDQCREKDIIQLRLLLLCAKLKTTDHWLTTTSKSLWHCLFFFLDMLRAIGTARTGITLTHNTCQQALLPWDYAHLKSALLFIGEVTVHRSTLWPQRCLSSRETTYIVSRLFEHVAWEVPRPNRVTKICEGSVTIIL